jgi:C4-dicarboxylate-specific signal transduction histidine kinase
MIAPSAKETTEVRVTAVVRDGNAAQELESEIARLKGVELALREREKELTEAHRIARLGTPSPGLTRYTAPLNAIPACPLRATKKFKSCIRRRAGSGSRRPWL